MKFRKLLAIFASLILLVIIFIIYSAKDLTIHFSSKKSVIQEIEKNKWPYFEEKIVRVEQYLDPNYDNMNRIKKAMKDIKKIHISPPSLANGYMLPPSAYLEESKVVVSEIKYDSSCPFQVNFVPPTNVQMLEMYKNLKFDNPDGGVWKQGWKIEVDEKEWNLQNKLKVFVVPHSHNDPGWLKTVEEYYSTQTKHILDNMVDKLPEDPRRKFIWAEISFFSMWWDDISDEDKETVRKLLRDNQLEIVTGGWVMNDEANSHWISIADQLTEGHQWLQENLNYTPISSWAIDPFGLSSTQPALLKGMGLQNMLIQRVHYAVKKQLASTKELEFRWRQLWDDKGKTEMFTHMMPFNSYDVPYTCGPDPKICCQFDFIRFPHREAYCPWNIAPVEITDKNVAERATTLLDQYRKKSKLYRTNVVLAPLGDDFRYNHSTEWDVQYTNYQKLFDYMNSHMNLNVQAQFGTLTDYFDAVHKEKNLTDFPTLSGDFFTYSDRDDHYWSGYYTSRPLYKRMERILLSYVRAADAIHTLTYLSGKGSSWIVDKDRGLEKILSNARRALSLFQHHDGVSGTSKNPVVIDYEKKMLLSIYGCQQVIQICTHILLNGYGADQANKNSSFYTVDDIIHSHDSLNEHSKITIGLTDLSTKKIVIFNPLTYRRKEVATFHISTPFVEVFDFNRKRIKCQTSPFFERASSISNTKYQLSFVVSVPAFSLVSYTVHAVYETNVPEETTFANVKVFNYYGEIRPPKGFEVTVSPVASKFTLYNSKVTALFNELGLLKALKTNDKTVPIHLDFARYGVLQNETCGTNLFLPDGPATSLPIENTIVNVVEGPIVSSVTVQLPYIRHSAILYNSPGADGLGLEIENTVDIAKTSNFEIAMRLSTNIDSQDEFFTDINGYQIMRRKRFKKLPLQANYYPIPTMAYIEDTNTRLSIVTSSPLGFGSLNPGQMEIMLDRRITQDESLGLGQGVMDNHPTKHIFRLILEKRDNPSCKYIAKNHPAGFPSLAMYMASQTLLNPMIHLLRVDDDDSDSVLSYTSVKQDVGIDFAVAVLRTGVTIKGKKHIGLMLHRQFIDVCFADDDLFKKFPLSEGTVKISNIIPLDNTRKVYKSSLSFVSIQNEVDGTSDIPMCPMDIQSFIL